MCLFQGDQALVFKQKYLTGEWCNWPFRIRNYRFVHAMFYA